MTILGSFLRPASDFAQRVRARNSVNFHPISKNKGSWYSGDRDLSVEHPQSRFGPILRDGYFWRRYLGVAPHRRVRVWDLKNPSPLNAVKFNAETYVFVFFHRFCLQCFVIHNCEHIALSLILSVDSLVYTGYWTESICFPPIALSLILYLEP